MKIQNAIKSIACAGMFALLILFPSQMQLGMSHGLELCIKTVIPALFPFMLVSIWARGVLSSFTFSVFRPVAKLFKINPRGIYLYILGLMGGYPTGAQLVWGAYSDKSIDTNSARKLLFYCNNPGPAFIFGMTGILFSMPWISWAIWGIQILSSLLCARLIDSANIPIKPLATGKTMTLPDSLERTCKVMALICGWVVSFRVLIGYLEQIPMPKIIGVILCGVLELSNGCVNLSMIDNEGLRFILCCVFLSFGGLCVCMQTASVVKQLGIRYYIYGKLFQTLYAFMLSYGVQWLCFESDNRCDLPVIWWVLFSVAGLLTFLSKKTVAFRIKPLYNT